MTMRLAVDVQHVQCELDYCEPWMHVWSAGLADRDANAEGVWVSHNKQALSFLRSQTRSQTADHLIDRGSYCSPNHSPDGSFWTQSAYNLTHQMAVSRSHRLQPDPAMIY